MALAPNQRKVPELKDPEGSWAKVTEDMDWIMDRFTWEAHKSLGRPVSHAGVYGTPSFEWVVEGHFLGREARDYLEEIWPGILEAAVKAFDAHDPTKGTKAHTYVERALVYQFKKEFLYWQKSSSRQPEEGVPWEMSLVQPELDDDASLGIFLAGVDGVDVENDERLAHYDPQDAEEETLSPRVQVFAQAVKEKLTEEEFEALQRHADGQSQKQIAEDMGFTLRKAQLMIERALRKAREVEY